MATEDSSREANPSYDALFKLLFKHRSMMISLVRCIGTRVGMPKPWLRAMNLDTFQPFSTEYIIRGLDPEDPLRVYFGDSTWIVAILEEYLEGTNGATRYFAIVHECQSGPDRTMHMRIEMLL